MRQEARQNWILIFSASWLLLQVAFPLFNKFDIHTGKYRAARFSWAMFTKPALNYEVSLFRLGPKNRKEPIENINSFIPNHLSPGPAKIHNHYESMASAKEYYQKLIHHISEFKGDENRYCVSISWTENHEMPQAPDWNYCSDEAQK